ncbi:hypothetical protein ACVWYG_002240 [Pedobacter sp. UYEF25]
MGQPKKQNEQMLLDGLQPKNDKYVCGDHIEDTSIQEFINKYSKEGTCSYCGAETQVAFVKDVIYFIKAGIFAFYGNPDDEGVGYDSSDGGYIGASIFDTDDMFEDANLNVNVNQLYKDIYHAFGLNNWCEQDPYADRENVDLNFKWENFKMAVKSESPYVFQKPKELDADFNELPVEEILNDIGLRIDALNLFKWLEPGTSFYRCRQHTILETLNTASQLTSPPDQFATLPNRMSPAGISMFYCAFEKWTCHLETVNHSDTAKELVTTGVFQNKERLYLLDLTNLPDLPSKFDTQRRKHFYSILFLHQFVSDLSRPINRDAPKDFDYLPTQIITDYFRYTYAEYTGACIDGILYPSSRTGNTNACVLFYDHKQSLNALEFVNGMLVVEHT